MTLKFTDIGRLFILRLRMRSQILKALLLVTTLSYIPARAQDPSRVQAINRDANGVDASAHAGVDEETLRVPQPSPAPVKAPATYSHWGITPSGQPPATQYWPAHASATTSADVSTDVKGALPRTSPPRQAGAQLPPSAVSSAHARINTSAQMQSDGKNIASPFTSPSFQAGAKQSPSTAWSVQPGGTSLEPASTDNFGGAEPQPNLLNRLATTSTQNAPEGFQRPKTVTAPVSPQSNGFSSPFSPYAQGVGFSSPFSGQRQTGGFSSPFSSSPFESQPSSQANSSRKRSTGRTRELEHSSQKTPGRTHLGAVAKFPNKRDKSAGSGPAAKTD